MAVVRARPQRFLHRLRVPESHEVQRTETVLATARAVLAIASLVAIYFDPTEPSRYARLAYFSLVIYVLHSLVILVLLRVRQEYKPRFSLVLHGVDIFWPAYITLFTEGPNSPFFLFFLFVLLAAAYRWSLKETIATASAAIVLLFAEAWLMTAGPCSAALFVEGQFEVNRLIIRATYLLIVGFLVGYLAEEEKLLRSETAVLARVMGKAQVEIGLRASLQAVLDEFLRLFDADQALLALQETRTGESFLWELARQSEGNPVAIRFSQIEPSRAETYFFPSAMDAWHAVRPARSGGERSFEFLALDSEGRLLRNRTGPLLDSFREAHPFSSALLGISFRFRGDWSGRLFLLDPRLGRSRAEELRFAQNLLRRVLPSVYNVYILRRLRSQAGMLERGRVARELHDGVIQTVSAAVMRMDLLRRQMKDASSAAAEELARIQQTLRQEVVTLREMMEQMKPLDLNPQQLLDYLADMVEKFRRETGINARFISDVEEVSWRPRVCREVVHIVQEGLVNVRRHSEARNVIVHLALQDGGWKLIIDDDGRGFPFSGRLSQSELDTARRGPMVIKERIRTFGGELTVDSSPGRGSRLEITIPQRG